MEYSSTDGNTTLLWVSPEKPAGQEATSRTLHGTIQVSSIKHIHIAVRPSCMLMCSVVSNSLRPHILQPTRLFCPQDSPGKNTGVGCHSLFQRIFPTQGLNPGLLHCRWILYQLSLEGLVLKLKLQYFGHLMQRTDSFEKSLILGKIEGPHCPGCQHYLCIMDL